MDRLKEFWAAASRTTKVAVVAIVAILVFAVAANAQQGPVCGGKEIVEDLANGYGEAPVVTGMMPGAAMQVWASEEGDTWTVLIITPEKICAVFAGGGLDMHGAEYPGESM